MTIRARIMKIVQHEGLNFVLTNRIPRRLATRWVGWFSKIENPIICAASLRIWRVFTDLDLSDAQETRFRSLHDCFTRRLKDGARPVAMDPAILTSPCDGIVGACGLVVDGQVLQVKGSAYALEELFGGGGPADGAYATLRLTSAMYHRFHAPHDSRVESVRHIFGDAWNVNPAALRRVDRLFCKNERAVIRMTCAGHAVTLIPVAAILVAGIRLRFLDMNRSATGGQTHACDAQLRKGEEMGWFEHGSTILVFAPAGFTLCEGIREGVALRAGQPLMRLPGYGT